MGKIHHHIYIDAIDKAGKNIVAKYIDQLGKHFFTISDRGIISNITYSRIFNRKYEYDLEQYKDSIFVYLTVEKEDWNIRCKLTNEPYIDFDLHSKEFRKTVDSFKNAGFTVLEFNTSNATPYEVALKVIEFIKALD